MTKVSTAADALSQHLAALNLTVMGLARRMGVPSQELVGIVRGTSAINAHLATRLGQYFGTPMGYWERFEKRAAQATRAAIAPVAAKPARAATRAAARAAARGPAKVRTAKTTKKTAHKAKKR